MSAGRHVSLFIHLLSPRCCSTLMSCLLSLSLCSETVEFTEFEPYYFRQIRLSVGITDDIYIKCAQYTLPSVRHVD